MDSAPARHSPPVSPAQRLCEQAVLLHLGLFGVVTAWIYGGQSPSGRTWVHLWGLGGAVLLILCLGWMETYRPGLRRRAWLDLWPLLAFDLIALSALANPTLRLVPRGTEMYLQLVDPPHPLLPSSARPDLAISQLLLLNGIVLSAYNAGLALRRRRQLRLLLVLFIANVMVLAVFGTFQKLLGADGLWFGLVSSPQPHFFSTFVYHNHWGAFVLLHVAACCGLLFRAWQRTHHRDFWHSPVLAGVVAVLLLSATIPLSSSRSSTFLLILLLAGAFAHAAARVIRERRARHESAVLPLAAVCLVTGLLLAGTAYLGRDVIRQRAATTVTQLAEAKGGYVGSRLQLYADTWRVTLMRPWFGWGPGSYGDVFRIYNSQRIPLDGHTVAQPYYRSAHSDWLQSLAENGFVGTALLALLVVRPAWRLRRQLAGAPVPRYLLAGCLILLLYAAVEFPFGNASVLLGFWSCFFLACRYAELTRGEDQPSP